MSHRPVLRVVAPLACSLAAATTIAASAHAASVFVGDAPIDGITSDGRYLAIRGADLLDRTTGTTVPPAPDGQTRVDLDGGSGKQLTEDDAGGLFVGAIGSPTAGARVNIGPDGAPVAADRAFLTHNGTRVIFSTATTPQRVIARDLATGTSTVLVQQATLLDASDDGRVITFSRSIPGATRPAGSAPLPGDPDGSRPGTAVGYVIDGGAPHIVSTSRVKEVSYAEDARGCATSVQLQPTTPSWLQVVQRGAQGGAYSFVLTEDTIRPGVPGMPSTQLTAVTRITPAGRVVLANSSSAFTRTTVFSDRESGAWASVTGRSRDAFFPATATLTGADGKPISFSVPPVEPTPDNPYPQQRSWLAIYPFNGGRGVAYTLRDTTGSFRTYSYIDDALPAPGPDRTPWMTLPRSADPVDGASTRERSLFLTCPTSAGDFDDYATLTTYASGPSAGSVAFIGGAIGTIRAREVRATVSWNGIPYWSKATHTRAIDLPALKAGLSGYRVTLTVTLRNGRTLSSTAPLTRTR